MVKGGEGQRCITGKNGMKIQDKQIWRTRQNNTSKYYGPMQLPTSLVFLFRKYILQHIAEFSKGRPIPGSIPSWDAQQVCHVAYLRGVSARISIKLRMYLGAAKTTTSFASMVILEYSKTSLKYVNQLKSCEHDEYK